MEGLSVSQLYPYAMAEGEGVGTAYEYFAKRLLLTRWMGPDFVPERILIAGTPEKYGSSLDFALIAHEFGAHLTVMDERPEALAKFEKSMTAVQKNGHLKDLSWHARNVGELAGLEVGAENFDLALSSEVLQRISESDQRRYVLATRQLALRVALFCPNADNPSHTDQSGLAGLTLENLQGLIGEWASRTGYIDMPPFPPGLTRSDEQRKQAATGRLESMVMTGLGLYARLERLVPQRIRRRQSHIVYAFSA